MGSLLFIPWFRAEAIEIPLPFELPGLGETLPIQPFGILVAIGVMVGSRLAEEFAKRNGMHPALIADLVTHVVILGFLSGYLLNAVFYHPEYIAELFDGGRSGCRYFGLSSFGGFFGAILGLFVWKWRRGLPALPFADAIVWALPFGWLFGRLGCFVVHDHPGVVTDFILAVENYEYGMPPFQPRHDLGFYEVLWSLGTIVLLLWLARKPRPRGFYVGLVPLLYTPVRFGLDFLRASVEEGGDARYLGLTPGHYASVILFLVGAAVMTRVLRGPQVEVPESARWKEPAK
ncbi:MAG: prolipoprotein diacylglyceryl transferase family protein [Myxococcota bacterium]